MVNIQDIIVHFDIFREHFVCDLEKCKGICCVEGDYGAPLENKEIRQIKKNLNHIQKYMTPAAVKLLKEQGFYETDPENDLVTTCINGRDCVFTYSDKQGVYKCAIESAWQDKKSSFRKPVSCHLYPIRVRQMRILTGVVYSRWEICSPACKLGESLKVPLYTFLKDPLIRKFGKKWYNELARVADELPEDEGRYE